MLCETYNVINSLASKKENVGNNTLGQLVYRWNIVWPTIEDIDTVRNGLDREGWKIDAQMRILYSAECMNSVIWFTFLKMLKLAARWLKELLKAT